MQTIQNAALALTKCWRCLGCNRLEDPKFRGDSKCQAVITIEDALTQKQHAKSESYVQMEIGHTGNWQKSFSVPKAQ